MVRQELVNKKAINLNGDRRCDSPGHSAKYGTYTLMDDDSGKVVAFSVIQVSQVISCNAMEKEGFKRCIESLQDDMVQIDRIATDRHVSISSFMNKDRPQINHQYDVWHLSKWVVKKSTTVQPKNFFLRPQAGNFLRLLAAPCATILPAARS